jgi:carboxyl-terminal processing protease
MKEKKLSRGTWILMVIIACGCFGYGQNPEPIDWANDTEAKIWGLMNIWSAAKYNFVYFDNLENFDWDQWVQSFIPRVIQARTLDEYYLLLRECAARLRDGHTMVLPPRFLARQLWAPALEMRLIREQVVVTRVGKNEALHRAGIKPGFMVTAIEGTPIDGYLEKHVHKYVSASTRQWLENFGLFLLLEGQKDSTVRIAFLDLKNRESVVSLKRDTNTVAGPGFKHSLFDNDPPVYFKTLKNGVVYIRLATFENPEIVKLFNRNFEALELKKIRGIIIDLRTNMGGQDRLAFEILSRFIDREVKTSTWKTRVYKPAFASWGNKEEWHIGESQKIKPHPGKRYTGPLVVLTGGMTNSSAEDFIMPLDFHHRAVLVGEPTAGSSGNPLLVQLPGGGIFMVCTKQDTYPDGMVFVGKGIQPHVRAENSRRDIIRGRDAVLKKGIEVIKNWKEYKKN